MNFIATGPKRAYAAFWFADLAGTAEERASFASRNMIQLELIYKSTNE